MQSEKKLRINGLLKLHSSSGVVNIKTLLDQFSDVKKDARISHLLLCFQCVILGLKDKKICQPIWRPIISRKKTMLRMTCAACKQKFSEIRELQHFNLEIDSDLLRYFEANKNVGVLFNVIQCAYNIFNVCISKYEQEFLKVVNQKQTLMGLFQMHISSIDYFSDHLLVYPVCKVERYAVTELFR